jgi:predicted DNA-binding helix-hairpin-helix protein
MEDLPFNSHGNLPARSDPKAVWAEQNLREMPVEVNKADRGELLRVPGIGPKGADAILKARHSGNLNSLEDLHGIGVNAARAKLYILLNGKRPPRQLALW